MWKTVAATGSGCEHIAASGREERQDMADKVRRARAHRLWKLGAATTALVTTGLVIGIAFAVSASAGPSGVNTTIGPPACTNGATLNGSAFEIDTNANLIVDSTNCIDWLSGGAGSGLRTGVFTKNDKGSGSGDDAFGQGTSENDANPTIVSGSIPPNKSDLKVFGLYQESGEITTAPPNPTGKFLALFWSRVQNPSGTTNMDFELNQKFCDPTATPTNCAINSKDPTVTPETPVRTAGDKLITYDLSKGGTVPTISIRTWTASGVWGPATVISGGNNPAALGSVNTSTITAANSDGVGPLDPFTFGEATITFGALFGTNQCGAFGSAYLKSRSSDSFTAEIKDFIAPEHVNITNCAGLTTSATPSVQIGNPISDDAILSGVSATAGGTITFHLFDAAGCAAADEVSTGLSPVTVSGPGTYNSGDFTPTAVGTYYWTASYSGDPNNAPASTACGDDGESSVVTKGDSHISTAQTLVPNDSATVTNSGALDGTLSFKLFAPNNSTCATGASDPAPVALTGTISFVLSGNSPQTRSTNNDADTDTLAGGVHADALGTWHWLVTYTGDSTLNDSSSNCVEAFTITEP
jgi:hypothetical protein